MIANIVPEFPGSCIGLGGQCVASVGAAREPYWATGLKRDELYETLLGYSVVGVCCTFYENGTMSIVM
jgi:hypothetical protein